MSVSPLTPAPRVVRFAGTSDIHFGAPSGQRVTVKCPVGNSLMDCALLAQAAQVLYNKTVLACIGQALVRGYLVRRRMAAYGQPEPRRPLVGGKSKQERSPRKRRNSEVSEEAWEKHNLAVAAEQLGINAGGDNNMSLDGLDDEIASATSAASALAEL